MRQLDYPSMSQTHPVFPRNSILARGSVVFLVILLSISATCGYAQPGPRSTRYDALQKRLEIGWNTWDVYSVTAHVLLPAGLAIRVGLQRKTTLTGEAFLADPLIGRQGRDVEQVFPGPHAWDGSYTDLRLSWRGTNLRIQSGHAGADLVILVTPLPGETHGALPATAVFSVAYLWNRPGTAARVADRIEARSAAGAVDVYCVGAKAPFSAVPVARPYLSAELSGAAGVSTGKLRTLEEIRKILEEQQSAYERSLGASRSPAVDTIQTTLGWDTIYEPEHDRVITPVSRVWSVYWGGYVLFDWDNFFAATLAGIGNRDLAYANAIETLRELTPAGFVANYARARDWKSFDRSEPPVGALSVLGRAPGTCQEIHGAFSRRVERDAARARKLQCHHRFRRRCFLERPLLSLGRAACVDGLHGSKRLSRRFRAEEHSFGQWPPSSLLIL
jgi:hypothetical protein